MTSRFARPALRAALAAALSGLAGLAGCGGGGGGPQPIAFVLQANLDQPDHSALYGFDRHGAFVRRVSGAPGAGWGVSEFEVSPDRSQVAFVADKLGPDLRQVFLADLEQGGEPVALTTPLPGAPKAYVGDIEWSSDGTRLLLYGDLLNAGNPRLWVVGLGGGAPVPLSAPAVQVYYSTWFWSPDGQWVTWMETDVINGPLRQMVAPAAGGAPVNVSGSLVAGGQLFTRQGRSPWAPDSSRLAFLADKTLDERIDLYSALPTGGAPTPLAQGASVSDDVVEFAWAPTSTLLAYRQGSALKTVPPTGGAQVTLSSANEYVQVFAWRPGQTQVAWSAHDNALDAEVLRLRPAGAPATITLYTSTGPMDEVDDDWRWSPDGERIAFRVGDIDIFEDHLRAFVVAVSAPGVTIPLVPGWLPTGDVSEYDLLWSPDSTRVVCRAQVDSTSPRQLFLTHVLTGLSYPVSSVDTAQEAVSDADFSHDGDSLCWIEGYSEPIERLRIADGDGNGAVTAVPAGPGRELDYVKPR